MRKLNCLILLCLVAGALNAQNPYKFYTTFEVGGQLGSSHYLGDLGGTPGVGKFSFIDTDLKETKGTGGLYFRYNFIENFSLRGELNYLKLSGTDANTRYNGITDNAYKRRIRNLSFNTQVFELHAGIDFNITEIFTSQTSKLIPYLYAGIGIFYFDPKAEYNNQQVRLQPLGTEGQGMAEFPDLKKYSLVQANIPLAAGLKYVINDRIVIGIEVMNRVLFTDYLDDVSTKYVDPALFASNIANPTTAALAAALADRRNEFNSDPSITTGSTRGNPKETDSYYTITIKFGYIFPAGKGYYGGGGNGQGCYKF